MDGARFDTLALSFNSTRSRRAALGGLLVGTLGLLTTAGVEDAATHDALLKCKKLRGDRKQKCVKKAKKHNATHANATPPGSPSEPTCSDGVQNGSETGVDCGGSCPRCATGQGCTSPNDCASAFCSGGTCQSCTMDPCGTDANGACICRGTDPPTASVCVTNSGRIADCGSGGAESCPPGEFCINNVGLRACYKPCGAP